MLKIQKSGEVLAGIKTKGGIVTKAANLIKGLFGLESEGEFDFAYEERPLAGASYDIYADGDVYTQDNQKDKNRKRTVWFNGGDRVARVTTGEDGRIKTLDYSVLEETAHSHMIRLRTEEAKDTGKDGEAVEEVLGLELPLGRYQVVEAEAPFGFVRDDEKYQVDFVWGGQNAEVVLNTNQKTEAKDGFLSFIDARAKAKIGVDKTDLETGAKIAGATFGLYATNDVYDADGNQIVEAGKLIATAVTDQNGVATFDADVPHKSPNHNNKTTDEKADAEEGDDNEDGETEEDGEEDGDDADEEELEGATESGNTEPDLEEVITTNSGNYFIKEIQAAAGYYTDGQPKGVRFEYGGQELELTELTLEWRNAPTKTGVVKTGLRVDGGEEPLAGAVLQIIDPETGEAVMEWVTEASLKEVERLAFGKEYILREKQPAPGYATAADVRFQITDASKPYNEVQEGEPRHKLKTLILNSNGEWVENADGLVKMADDFTKIVLFKSDAETLEPVEGATLELKDSSGAVLLSWESGCEPQILNLAENGEEFKNAPPVGVEVKEGGYLVTGLPIGTYTLHEAQTPFEDGYVTAADMEVVVADTGGVQEAAMLDDYTKVRISKSDLVTGKELKGAKLQLLQDGEVIEEWVSGKKPHYFERLPVGEYVLRETQAPKGYEIAEEVAVKIKDDGKIQKFVMKDAPSDGDKDDGKPKTGDSTRLALYLVLSLTGALGMGATTLKYKKRNKVK